MSRGSAELPAHLLRLVLRVILYDLPAVRGHGQRAGIDAFHVGEGGLLARMLVSAQHACDCRLLCCRTADKAAAEHQC